MGERATPASDRLRARDRRLRAAQRASGRSRPSRPTAEATAHVHAPVPSISALREPAAELDRVFQRALAKDPQARLRHRAPSFVAALRERARAAARRHDARRSPAAGRRSRPAARSRPSSLLLLLAGSRGRVAAIFTAGGGRTRRRDQTRSPGRAARPRSARRSPSTTAAAAAPAASAASSAAAVAGSGHSLNDQGNRADPGGRLRRRRAAAAVGRPEAARLGTGDTYEAYANYNLGYALDQLGRCSEALPYLERARPAPEHRPAIASGELCEAGPERPQAERASERTMPPCGSSSPARPGSSARTSSATGSSAIPTTTSSRYDLLTYAGNRAEPRRHGGPVPFVQARHRATSTSSSRRLREHDDRRRRQLRGRVAQQPRGRRPGPLLRAPTCSARRLLLEAARQRRGRALPPHLDLRGLRRPAARLRRGRSPRSRRTGPRTPYNASKAGGRPRRARLPRDVRAAGRRSPTARTTTGRTSSRRR